MAPLPAGPRATGNFKLSGVMGGLIALEYEGKTIRFGAALDEAEAQVIVERMQQRYAFGEAPATA